MSPQRISLPHLPDTAPFSAAQRAWLHGWLAALTEPSSSDASPSPAVESLGSLTILFGSQTGTAEGLARQAASKAGTLGWQATCLEMNDWKSVDWAPVKRLLLVTSTWGDGDPPDNATGFWDLLHGEDPLPFQGLEYSVLALGDSSYSDFCGAGRKMDEQLQKRGGISFLPRQDCDLDYEALASQWIQAALIPPTGSSTASSSKETTPPGKEEAAAPVGTRKNPYLASLIESRALNGPGSSKDTRHIAISLKDSGLTYVPGDALGVLPRNCPDLVNEILQALGLDGTEMITYPDGQEGTLTEGLLGHWVLNQVPPKLAEWIATQRGATAWLEQVQQEPSGLKGWLEGRDLLDVLRATEGSLPSIQELCSQLPKLQPRLYSIASSARSHPGEVHLTVGVVRYETQDRIRKGVCSTFLGERARPGDPLPVFFQTSPKFRLPENPSTPIIMVGPGTGIAPFRAFLEERALQEDHGPAWLFFGDQHASTDFLYREELEGHLASGALTRLDTAFSRDQQAKCYVQHRMSEGAEELWKWLEQGAHFYVCGDAKRMAKDVDAALRNIPVSAGGLSEDEAATYIDQLKSQGRYQRDVY